jgi:ATP-dependent DNA helicase RecG
MRPSILPLFGAAANLPGIEPKTAKFLDRLSTDGSRQARALDLLFHQPHAAIDSSS